MADRFEDRSLVKHKTDGYSGWVDGTTSIKAVFTGNMDTLFQYRVKLVNQGGVRVAPHEDLELVRPPQETPVGRRKKTAADFKKETDLFGMGYRVTNMDREGRWRVLRDIAIPKIGVAAVVHTILGNMGVRSTSENNAKRNENALFEWNKDLCWMIEKYPEEPFWKEQSVSWRINTIREKLRTFQIIKEYIPL
ncbi:MAG: hypothetical protein HQL19_08260 [Candidatus Omnitrophica bacterium]|nr:hypothetical protein [Candidatus Omnitrophota bacterium]